MVNSNLNVIFFLTLNPMVVIYIYIYIFDPTVITFIVISISHNFEIQTVNSNLTLNPLVNSNLKVIFFF